MTGFEDRYWWSNDGLRLHYRDYFVPTGKPPIICLPGLTRNARDFEPLADRLSTEWRLICPDLRGRGDSAYAKDPLTYVPLQYLQDIEALVADLGLKRFILFGTSLGGILSMLMSAMGNGRIAAVLLNDVGPHLDPAGLARIRTYVGKPTSWPTWLHAARGLAETNANIFPDYDLHQWLAMAKRLCKVTPAGRIVFDYDMKIAEPFRLPGAEAGVDLWPAFLSLKDIPTLLIRGGLSDLLSDNTANEMAAKHPNLTYVTVERAGHAPLLDEPAATQAIDRLLASVR